MNIKLSDTSPLELPPHVEEQFRPTVSEEMVIHWPEYEAWELVDALVGKSGAHYAQSECPTAPPLDPLFRPSDVILISTNQMSIQGCPKCGSPRVQRGFDDPPMILRLLFVYDLYSKKARDREFEISAGVSVCNLILKKD